MVHQILYSSAGLVGFDDDQLLELLKVARSNNSKLGVSGMLLYAEGSFIQVLEGEQKVVEELFAKIEKDPRHGEARVLLKCDVPKRTFTDWSMGFRRVNKLSELPAGLSSFLYGRGSAAESADAAIKAMYGFRDGRWRQAG